MAARFDELPEPTRSLTLARLFHLYHDRRPPKKRSETTREHDHRAARLFMAAFGSGFDPRNLDRACWDHYIEERRTGRLVVDGRKYGPVRDRAVQQDLKLMIAVLTWGCGFLENGRPLLERNPWGVEIRRAQRWEMPRERTPRRPPMTEEIRSLLCRHAPNWQMVAALQLGRDTISRNSSVRRLQWSDVDLKEGTVRWRGGFDKSGREIVTPLSDEAIRILQGVPRRLGSPWVFASEADPMQPTRKDVFQLCCGGRRTGCSPPSRTSRSGPGWRSGSRGSATTGKSGPGCGTIGSARSTRSGRRCSPAPTTAPWSTFTTT